MFYILKAFLFVTQYNILKYTLEYFIFKRCKDYVFKKMSAHSL